MTEILLNRPIRNLSSGFVGTLGCWVGGLGLAAASVAFSMNGSGLTKVIGGAILLIGAVFCGLARTASARWKLRLTALLISVCMVVLIAEVVLRCVTQFPVNTASNMVPHSELGYVLDPQLSGVDANGFRNDESLTQVDIVAIGDSHTQGGNASAQESWPHLLGRQVNQIVYNMGVGGYGPLQYDILVAKALGLKPKQIIIGLYVGNDLADVARGIHHRNFEQGIDNTFRHTLSYKTATGSAIHQWIKRSQFGRPSGFSVAHTSNPIFVGENRVRFLSSGMDVTVPKIAAGLKETVNVLSRAQRRCSVTGVELCVLLIPTRESVYGHSQQVDVETLPGELKQLAEREANLRQQLYGSLKEQGVKCVDLLPLLVSAVDAGEQLYSAHDEGYPLGAGYRVYADVAAASIRPAPSLTN